MPNIYHTNKTLRVSLRSSSVMLLWLSILRPFKFSTAEFFFQISLLLFQFKGEVDGIFFMLCSLHIAKRVGVDLSGWMMSTSKWTRTPQKPCTHLRIRPHSQQRYWIVEAQQKPETIKFSCKFKRLEMGVDGGKAEKYELWIERQQWREKDTDLFWISTFQPSRAFSTQPFFVGKFSSPLSRHRRSFHIQNRKQASMREKEKHGKVLAGKRKVFFSFFHSLYFGWDFSSLVSFFWIRIVSGCGFSGCYRKYQWLIPFYKIWITVVNLWD